MARKKKSMELRYDATDDVRVIGTPHDGSRVQLSFHIKREQDRDAVASLSPDDAEFLGNRLKAFADLARNNNTGGSIVQVEL